MPINPKTGALPIGPAGVQLGDGALVGAGVQVGDGVLVDAGVQVGVSRTGLSPVAKLILGCQVLAVS